MEPKKEPSIRGVGVDIVEVARIQKILDKDSGFVERIFNEGEIEYCRGKFRPAQHYAARFTAKEAFLKALGTGYRDGIGWQEIYVCNDELGKPSIELLGKAREKFESFGLNWIHLSLSHSREYAVAFVVLE